MSSRACMVSGNLSVVDRILETKRTTKKTHVTFFYAVLNFCLAGLFYLELTCRSIDWLILRSYSWVWYIVFALVCCFGINGVFLLIRYTVARLRSSTLEITLKQQRLCGVSNREPGFRIIPTNSSAITSREVEGPNYSLSGYTGRMSYSCNPSPIQQSQMMTSSFSPVRSFDMSLSGLSPQEIIVDNWSPSHFHPVDPFGRLPCYNSPRSITSQQGSASYLSSSLPDTSYHRDGSCNTPASLSSPMSRGSSVSPAGPCHNNPAISSADISSFSNSPAYLVQQDILNESIGLRSRHRQHGSAQTSPVRSDDFITNVRDLDSFLKDSDMTKDLNAQGCEMRNPSGGRGGFSFWSFNRSLLDYIPVIRRFQYQLAPHSPPQTTTCVDQGTQRDFTTCPVSEDVWSKLNIEFNLVNQWTENLRKWISQTILNRLVNEVNEVNKALVNIGSEEVKIGEVSLSALKQISLTKAQQVPILMTLIPFLELTGNQEYLVQRIKELSSGGCMSLFKWNNGGEFKGKPWEENLPTDAAIVLHVLCCYMDSRLPSHPKYPDGKTFSNQHLLRAPDKPNLKDRKDHLLIYERQIHPPHYNVVIEDTVWNIKPGRTNLFHAILLFLHHVKTKEHGMLRRVSLGLSGINILWALD